ncbi:hypothetical protein BJV74DRAFT_827209 [Russula compacta]|nr:hypothetical protein BJV74DRAFT_827209 [Russula compacta]
MPSSSLEKFEPEHAIEQSNLALCVISGQGELRCRDPPIVVDQEDGGCMVIVSFVALPEEAFQLFVCNYSPLDASADISASSQSLGKWLIAATREPKVWYNVACDSLFKFQDSYDRRSQAFHPTTIEIKFQRLSKVEEGPDQNSFVPMIMRQPSPEDGPGYVVPSDDLMQSKFEAMDDSQFLTFVLLFYPPAAAITFPLLQTTSIANPEPGPASASSSESSSASSSDSISQMSDDELQEALTEYKNSRLLLPARLTPGLWGRLAVEDFCQRYELPEEIRSALTQMKVKDAHSLSKIYLRELRDNGLALRSINMLRLAVIKFSFESRP